MRFLLFGVFLIGGLAATGARADVPGDEMVPVPGDYSYEEVPISGVLKTKVDFLFKTNEYTSNVTQNVAKDSVSRTDLVCTARLAEDTDSSGRREIAKGSTLTVTTREKQNTGVTTPGYCFTHGSDVANTHGYFLTTTAEGQNVGLECYTHSVWIPAAEGQPNCDFQEVPQVDDLKPYFDITAHQKDLTKIIK